MLLVPVGLNAECLPTNGHVIDTGRVLLEREVTVGGVTQPVVLSWSAKTPLAVL